jgi:serine/threonine protein kinase
MGDTARQVDPLLETGQPRTFGRYVLYSPIARGGMATIHVARLVGDDGFSRIVAAKRLHPQFTEDPDFVEMFRDEAEIASKIRHPNVVPVLDIVLDGEEVILVQEYVHGVPLDRLFRAACARAELIPPRIVVGIVAGVLAGLHSAHETADEQSNPLGIIHRDVSPQNIMVSTEGIPRLLDFGIAKARSSAHVTRAGLLMGKVAYMAPEQVRGEGVTRGADLYSCGVVLWELLALRRLHTERAQAQILAAVLSGQTPTLMEALEPMREAISKDRWQLLERLEPIVSKATAMHAEDRYESAAEMLHELVRVAPPASALEVAEWVKVRGREYLERRQAVLARVEESWRSVSRIAVPTPMSGPVSGVQRVREPSVVTASRLSVDTQSPSAMYVPLEPDPDLQVITTMREKHTVPWVVAAASIVVAAMLAGALWAARRPVASPPVASQPEPTTAVVAAPPVVSQDPPVAAPSFLAAPMLARTVRAAAAPAPMRKPVVEPMAIPARAAPVAAVATPAIPPKADCDPPFYFEGTKKIFKASCL